MVTYKQLEAFHWICELGGFQRAADRLHTSQAAISKRIAELEAAFDVRLFDRSNRDARLTAKAQEIRPQVEEMLRQRSRIEESLGRPEVLVRTVRIGVTELTALTWLPVWVGRIRKRYPHVIIEPDVDSSVNLAAKLARNKVDVIVLPDALELPGCTKIPLATVENAWFCKPGLISSRRVVSLGELSRLPLLTQGNLSGAGLILGRWLGDNGIRAVQDVTSNNLTALIGLTVSGLGVAPMPLHGVRGLIGAKLLSVVRTDPPIPAVAYVAAFQVGNDSRLVKDMVDMARQCCDYEKVFRSG